MPATPTLPVLALVAGDYQGIAPELIVKVLADESLADVCRLRVVGDIRVLEEAAKQMKWPALGWHRHADFIHLPNGEAQLATGGDAVAAGRAALQNFEVALRLAAASGVAGVSFTPFTKRSMKLADPSYVDEIEFIAARYPAGPSPMEFNVLDELWNARVTSHIALGEVPAALSSEKILARLVAADALLRSAGKSEPRIAVAALNPHGGDGGNFGDEESRIIAPAVAAARARGIRCDGPHPADSVFVHALKHRHDAVLTMYHDQGQIAMKLLGFGRGVTLIGGFAFPVTTPAHGSAHDIAGKGVADPGGTLAAIRLAARLARAKRESAS